MLGGAVSVNRFVLPANLLPISIIYLNGGRQEEQFFPELCRWQVATLRLRESFYRQYSGTVY